MLGAEAKSSPSTFFVSLPVCFIPFSGIRRKLRPGQEKASSCLEHNEHPCSYLASVWVVASFLGAQTSEVLENLIRIQR